MNDDSPAIPTGAAPDDASPLDPLPAAATPVTSASAKAAASLDEPALLASHGITRLRSGKVRDLYRWKDELWLIASDRISAFDVVLPTLIPGKGAVLTKLSQHWFEVTKEICANQVISFELPEGIDIPSFRGRITRAKLAEVVPVECVARGYIAGSGWKEYQEKGTVGGYPCAAGLQESSELPEPLFTPSTKAEHGHDVNLTKAEARALLGDTLYKQLAEVTLGLYRFARDYARARGIIIADTKFEFGKIGDQLVLIDEVLTPDSSRFWPLGTYQPGRPQASFDKQYVRDYLEGLDWDKQPPGPMLTPRVVEQTLAKYQEALDRLTGPANAE